MSHTDTKAPTPPSPGPRDTGRRDGGQIRRRG